MLTLKDLAWTIGHPFTSDIWGLDFVSSYHVYFYISYQGFFNPIIYHDLHPETRTRVLFKFPKASSGYPKLAIL